VYFYKKKYKEFNQTSHTEQYGHHEWLHMVGSKWPFFALTRAWRLLHH